MKFTTSMRYFPDIIKYREKLNRFGNKFHIDKYSDLVITRYTVGQINPRTVFSTLKKYNAVGALSDKLTNVYLVGLKQSDKDKLFLIYYPENSKPLSSEGGMVDIVSLDNFMSYTEGNNPLILCITGDDKMQRNVIFRNFLKDFLDDMEERPGVSMNFNIFGLMDFSKKA